MVCEFINIDTGSIIKRLSSDNFTLPDKGDIIIVSSFGKPKQYIVLFKIFDYIESKIFIYIESYKK